LILGLFDLLKPWAWVFWPSEVIYTGFGAVEVLGAARAQYCEDCFRLQVSIGGEPAVNPEGFMCSESDFTVYFTCRDFYSAVIPF